MTEAHHHHHRHERQQSRFERLLRAYWVEALIVVALALAIFLLFEQMNIRGTLLGWAEVAGAAGLGALERLVNAVARFRAGLGLSELIAIPMLLGVLLALIWRVRWRLERTPSLTTLLCPRCKSDLHRIHRRTSDRLLGLFIPLRRYRCSNRECGWSGLRVASGHQAHSPSLSD